MKRSIKRLPKQTQEELTVLLDLVRQNVENCQMVILYGSYARGKYVLWDSKIEFGVRTSYQSDYDILVVINGHMAKKSKKGCAVSPINIISYLKIIAMLLHNL